MRACWMTKESKEEDETVFMRNGRMLLETSIKLCNGKCNPMRNFSSEELVQATNNYEKQQILDDDRFHVLYKGFLQDRLVTIKKFRHFTRRQDIFNEIVFASQMSAHKNSLKLLGCCLETEFPALIIESVQKGTLADRIHGSGGASFQPLFWKSRLRIAMDIASAVAYLHTAAFSRPVVHRHIRAWNIFLDEESVAKLSDYSLSVVIPEDELHVEDDLIGTVGYISPEYLATGCFNEKHDVFSYGIVLLELLTGHRPYDPSLGLHLRHRVKECMESNRTNEIVDLTIQQEGPWPGKEEQLKAFAKIALQSVSESKEDRPEMIDVAKQLKKLHDSSDSLQ